MTAQVKLHDFSGLVSLSQPQQEKPVSARWLIDNKTHAIRECTATGGDNKHAKPDQTWGKDLARNNAPGARQLIPIYVALFCFNGYWNIKQGLVAL